MAKTRRYSTDELSSSANEHIKLLSEENWLRKQAIGSNPELRRISTDKLSPYDRVAIRKLKNPTWHLEKNSKENRLMTDVDRSGAFNGHRFYESQEFIDHKDSLTDPAVKEKVFRLFFERVLNEQGIDAIEASALYDKLIQFYAQAHWKEPLEILNAAVIGRLNIKPSIVVRYDHDFNILISKDHIAIRAELNNIRFHDFHQNKTFQNTGSIATEYVLTDSGFQFNEVFITNDDTFLLDAMLYQTVDIEKYEKLASKKEFVVEKVNNFINSLRNYLTKTLDITPEALNILILNLNPNQSKIKKNILDQLFVYSHLTELLQIIIKSDISNLDANPELKMALIRKIDILQHANEALRNDVIKPIIDAFALPVIDQHFVKKPYQKSISKVVIQTKDKQLKQENKDLNFEALAFDLLTNDMQVNGHTFTKSKNFQDLRYQYNNAEEHEKKRIFRKDIPQLTNQLIEEQLKVSHEESYHIQNAYKHVYSNQLRKFMFNDQRITYQHNANLKLVDGKILLVVDLVNLSFAYKNHAGLTDYVPIEGQAKLIFDFADQQFTLRRILTTHPVIGQLITEPHFDIHFYYENKVKALQNEVEEYYLYLQKLMQNDEASLPYLLTAPHFSKDFASKSPAKNLLVQKYEAVQQMRSILNDTEISLASKLNNFSNLVNQHKTLLKSGRDSVGLKILKVIASIFSFGIAAKKLFTPRSEITLKHLEQTLFHNKQPPKQKRHPLAHPKPGRGSQ